MASTLLDGFHKNFKFSIPEPTGLSSFGKLQWDSYVKNPYGKYVHSLGYPTIYGSDVGHVIVYARNLRSAERKIRKEIDKVIRLYR